MNRSLPAEDFEHGVSPCRLRSLAAVVVVGLIRGYQGLISPLLGPHCRFQPTCSEYMIQAIRGDGLWRGVLRGLGRIGRCHPLGGQGHDPP